MKEPKYTVKFTTQFKKDYKLAMKRGLKISLLEGVVAALAMGETLPDANKDHSLTGNWSGHRECLIQPDWLLVYRIEDDVLVLTLVRTGTHGDLFGILKCRRMGIDSCTAVLLWLELIFGGDWRDTGRW